MPERDDVEAELTRFTGDPAKDAHDDLVDTLAWFEENGVRAVCHEERMSKKKAKFSGALWFPRAVYGSFTPGDMYRLISPIVVRSASLDSDGFRVYFDAWGDFELADLPDSEKRIDCELGAVMPP